MKANDSYNKILLILGTGLAGLREKKGYHTITEFAKEYDLPEIQYGRMEKGQANITLKSLVKILAIHQLTIHDFFCMILTDEGFINN